MYLSKQKYMEIKKEFSSLLILEDDERDALSFVFEVLQAEAEAVREKCPYAFNSIKRLEEAAHEVFELGMDVEQGEFDENDEKAEE